MEQLSSQSISRGQRCQLLAQRCVCPFMAAHLLSLVNGKVAHRRPGRSVKGQRWTRVYQEGWSLSVDLLQSGH